MVDLDTIRERHVIAHAPNYKPYESSVCDYCRKPWPCDTRVVLSALDETTRFSVDSLAAALLGSG